MPWKHHASESPTELQGIQQQMIRLPSHWLEILDPLECL